MGKRLTAPSEASNNGIKLARAQDRPFRLSFSEYLDNGFEIKDMSRNHLTEFHKFLSDTVYKELTISQVDQLFLRKRGMSAVPLKRGEEELIHYGKDRNPFRLFGYYNQDGYFVICRIDGNHRTNE